jgi:hypothetical protein
MRIDAARILELGLILQIPARAPHAFAAGVYNVGEASTPTIAERLAWLPPSAIEADLSSTFDFTQNIAYDTSRIRTGLGYRDISEEEGVLRTLGWRKLIHLCNRKPYEPGAELRLQSCKRGKAVQTRRHDT